MTVELKKKDYIWSYMGVILSVCSSIIMTPFVIHFLDGDMLGLWYIFQSLAAITTLFDFGFSTTFARNINYCWSGAEKLEKVGAVFTEAKEPNFYLMKKAMRACQTVFLLLSIAALVTMLTIGTVYIQSITSEIESNAPLIAWVICAVAIFLNLYFGYFNSFLRGVGAIAAVNQATVIARGTQILMTFLLLACGAGIIGTSVAYLIYGTLFRFLGRRYFFKFRGIGEELKRVTASAPSHEVKEMFYVVWHNAWREGLVSLANYLANQASTIICSLYMSLSETATYSLGVQLATALSNVAAVMYTANQPVLQASFISKDEDRMRRSMAMIVLTYIALYGVGLAGIVGLGLPVLRLIRPQVVVGIPVMLGIGLYQFMLKFRNCYTSYFSCTNRIIYVKAFLISSILCVFLSLFAIGVMDWGIWGLIIAQLVSQGAYNFWAWTVKAHREMKLPFASVFTVGFSEIKGMLRRR